MLWCEAMFSYPTILSKCDSNKSQKAFANFSEFWCGGFLEVQANIIGQRQGSTVLADGEPVAAGSCLRLVIILNQSLSCPEHQFSVSSFQKCWLRQSRSLWACGVWRPHEKQRAPTDPNADILPWLYHFHTPLPLLGAPLFPVACGYFQPCLYLGIPGNQSSVHHGVCFLIH